jgi:hypothetical protein
MLLDILFDEYWIRRSIVIRSFLNSLRPVVKRNSVLQTLKCTNLLRNLATGKKDTIYTNGAFASEMSEFEKKWEHQNFSSCTLIWRTWGTNFGCLFFTNQSKNVQTNRECINKHVYAYIYITDLSPTHSILWDSPCHTLIWNKKHIIHTHDIIQIYIN